MPTNKSTVMRLQEVCPQLQLEAHMADQPGPTKPLPKKLTRAQVIKNLLAAQATQAPAVDKRLFEEMIGYLKCQKFGINIHKRTNEAAFQTFIASACIGQAYTIGHQGQQPQSVAEGRQDLTQALWTPTTLG